MKKTYMKPEMEIVKLHVPQLLLTASQEAHEEAPDEYGAPYLQGDGW